MKKMPHNLEAEEALIGCCLIDPEILDRCQEARLEPEAFFKPQHETIFGCLTTLHRNQVVIDEITLAEELNRIGQFEDLGGFPFINEISSRVHTTAGANGFIAILKEKHTRRKIIRSNTKAIEDAYGSDKTCDEISAEQQGALSELQGEASKTLQPAREVVEQAYREMCEMRDGKRSPMGITTGLIDLDRITMGWKPSKLVILAARPGIGKSSLAIKFAAAAAMGRNPVVVLFFTIEMENKEVVERFVCHEARVPFLRFIEGLTGAEQNQRVSEAAQAISRSPIWFEERSDLNVYDIRSTARRLCRKHSIGMVVVDYLQIVNGVKGDKKNREQEVSEISRNLKAMSKELALPVIALAQLNRDLEKDKRKPRMSDLRESGSLEQDADIVMFLSRNPEQNDQTTTLDVAKQRGGATGEITLTWTPEITRFDNFTDNFNGH